MMSELSLFRTIAATPTAVPPVKQFSLIPPEQGSTQNNRKRAHEDWGSVMQDLLLDNIAKQETALHKLNRLLSCFLIDLRTWRYREHWEDLRQTVLLKLIESFRKGQLREMKAFVAYTRIITRNVFNDLVGERQWELIDVNELVDITEEACDRSLDDETSSVRSAIEQLPAKLKTAVEAVYLTDLTYEEAARAMGVPLGSLKRYLQQGLVQLRSQLAG
jgi:RNA polymerase sigma factor (sigma-70 family)